MLTGRDTQTDRMGVKLLFLTVVLLFSPLLTLCDPLFVLSAPNLLRVGSSENVFVEAQDYSGAAIEVKIIVKNHPKKDREILSQSVRLTADNNFQIIKDIKIPDDQNYFSDNPLEKHSVQDFLFDAQPGTTQSVWNHSGNHAVTALMLISVFLKNPQGITVSSEKIFPVKGMKSGKYPIPEIASPGIWKVVTLFSNTPQKKFTADFEVKEYVLPTFEVKLKPSKSFFYVGDPSLTVDIEAKYLFGQKVDGNAFVVFGVMNGEKKISIPTSLQKVQIIRGEGIAELTSGMITKTFPNINQLVGQSIYVSVSVLTESGSEMVEAERRGIQIVTSPYSIHFKKTTQFFKPGMPFDVSVYVTNPDQTPAVNVEVEVVGSQGTVKGQTKHNGIAKVTVNTLGGSSTQEITAKTKDPQLRDNQQAVKKMTAHAYIPKDASKKNYLHIGIDAAELQMGDSMKVFLNTGQSPGVKDQDYTYMILSKGQIVSVDRFKRRGQSLVSLAVPVTKEMVPSFRFVAYYHVGSLEVVSDSVWVDVKDTCMGKLQVKVKDKMNTYDTGDEVTLEITGDPGAKVGLVVVDKAVQVLNKNRLTQTQIWDVIEKHDTGLPECPKPSKRRRRAESLLKITSTLGISVVLILTSLFYTNIVFSAEKYSGELKQCCVDGMRENKLGYTCDRRSRYIADGKDCVDAFLHCCNQMKTHKDMKDEVEEMVLARSDDDDDYYTESEEIVSRTQFPESWLWEEIDLCDKCEIPTKEKAIYLKDSITTWQILAISLSPTLGICVAEPEEIVVFKSLFIDLKMPYSAVRGEQLEIRAIIHNYTPKKQKVRVEFMETEDVCSSASKKGKYRTIVTVDKGSSISVSYVIIPMTLGNHMIEVKASAYDSIYTDGVRKPLKVVAEGVLVPLQRQNLELNPAKNGEKPILLKGEIPADRVPDTPANTYISITGKEIDAFNELVIFFCFVNLSK
ncbi:hypothetical protein cypCar_00045414 [Cyprinus carpio]|nr:hypothetical protein cypCar_00045414 [Cyprinus carpio]